MRVTVRVEELAGPIVFDDAPARLKDVLPRFWSVSFSPNGESLAVTAGWEQPDEPGQVVLWDLESRSLKLIRRQGKTIRSAAFSPDGKLLAICDFGGNTKLLDSTSGDVVVSLPTRTALVDTIAKGTPGTAGIAKTIAFSPDGTRFVTGTWDSGLTIWDVESGDPLRELAGHKAALRNAVFSPSGEVLATSDAAGIVLLWSPATGKRMDSIDAHNARCSGLAFSRDGTRLATASWDRSAKVWDTKDWTHLFTLGNAP